MNGMLDSSFNDVLTYASFQTEEKPKRLKAEAVAIANAIASESSTDSRRNGVKNALRD